MVANVAFSAVEALVVLYSSSVPALVSVPW